MQQGLARTWSMQNKKIGKLRRFEDVGGVWRLRRGGEEEELEIIGPVDMESTRMTFETPRYNI